MEYLPTDISHRILSNLPTVTLATFKCVCKAWYNLASHPDVSKFSKNPCIILHSNKIANELFIINGNDLLEKDCFSAREARPIMKFKVPFLRDGYNCDSLLSCNGLLLISYSMRNRSGRNIQKVSVYNPILNKFRRLPESNPVLFGQDFECSYGFGFVPTLKQYKVVRVIKRAYNSELSNKDLGQLVYIFTLGRSMGWRIVNNKSFSINIDTSGVSVDGTLYWKGYHWTETGRERCIVSFDLVGERFSSISFPDKHMTYDLAVVEGGLSVFGGFHYLKIWSVSKCGDKDYSWSKILNIELRSSSFSLMNLPNGNIFLVSVEDSSDSITIRNIELRYQYCQTIDCYNLKEGCYKYLIMKDLPFLPQRATTLVVSLVWPFA